jgi:hypothetical protein
MKRTIAGVVVSVAFAGLVGVVYDGEEKPTFITRRLR